jgi:hypothetical protein
VDYWSLREAGGLLVPEGSWWTISPTGKLVDFPLGLIDYQLPSGTNSPPAEKLFIIYTMKVKKLHINSK